MFSRHLTCEQIVLNILDLFSHLLMIIISEIREVVRLQTSNAFILIKGIFRISIEMFQCENQCLPQHIPSRAEAHRAVGSERRSSCLLLLRMEEQKS